MLTRRTLLAAAVRRTLDERWNHRAAAVRFRDELEDHMSPDYADETLRAVITWGRYAELFDYDADSGQLRLELPLVDEDGQPRSSLSG